MTPNRPLHLLITQAKHTGYVELTEETLALLEHAAIWAQADADDQAFQDSLDDTDRAHIAKVDAFFRNRNRRHARQQFGR